MGENSNYFEKRFTKIAFSKQIHSAFSNSWRFSEKILSLADRYNSERYLLSENVAVNHDSTFIAIFGNNKSWRPS